MAKVVGYNIEGTILCLQHAEEWAKENNADLETDERAFPIFDDDEWDYIPTCEECGEALDVTPTSDGLRWIAEEFESAEAAEKKLGSVGRHWYELAERLGIARSEPEVEEEEEEEILAKMRQIDEILEKLLRG